MKIMLRYNMTNQKASTQPQGTIDGKQIRPQYMIHSIKSAHFILMSIRSGQVGDTGTCIPDIYFYFPLLQNKTLWLVTALKQTHVYCLP